MSFQTIWRRVAFDVGSMPAPLAKTHVNEALGLIYDSSLWSFQIRQGGWLTGGLVNTGGITVASFSTQVVANAAATAAWAVRVSRPLITEMQLRVASGTLYNIVGYDDGTDPQSSPNPGFATLTLDRAWTELPVTNGPYMIYQAYYPAPAEYDGDFKRFLNIRSLQMGYRMRFWNITQKDLNRMDPQRLVFDLPKYAVSAGTDQRTGSATFGAPMYELWPHPVSVLPYSFDYLRRGPMLDLPNDTIPSPLTDELVVWRAKELAFVWKESQRGEQVVRGSGANYQFLSQMAESQYKSLFKVARDRDQEICDLYFSRMETQCGFPESFATADGHVSIGGW